MTAFYTWEEWPGLNEETRAELEVIASTIREDCQGWGDVFNEAGVFTGDRVLIRGTMPRELPGEVG